MTDETLKLAREQTTSEILRLVGGDTENVIERGEISDILDAYAGTLARDCAEIAKLEARN